MAEFVTNLIASVGGTIGISPIDLAAVTAITLVCLACGLVGSLVLGNRMAFFSDAMAHTAFAGVASGLLGILILGQPTNAQQAQQYFWLVPLVTVVVGIAVGMAMECVRERTGLANDTVIGVFFAAAVGFAVTLIPGIKKRIGVDPDSFLFGSPLFVSPEELLMLFFLVLTAAAVTVWRYNALAFAVVSPPLARSRGFAVRWGNYLFIVLLALVVNVSIKAVGVLLMNALLIVPAAAAANISANARQMTRNTLIISLLAGWLGYGIAIRTVLPIGIGEPLELSPGGTIVVTAVGLFFGTLLLRVVMARFGFNRPGAAQYHDHGPSETPAGCCGV